MQMHPSTLTSPVLLINRWIKIGFMIGFFILCAQGCASRAPSLRVLDTRAGYGNEMDDEEVALYERSRKTQDSALRQGGHRVATAYIYPHELPTRDYFWGAYVSLLIGEEAVSFENPDDESFGPGIKETKKGKKKTKRTVEK